MSDFLTRTAQLALGLAHSVEPLIAPRFAPMETLEMPRDESVWSAEARPPLSHSREREEALPEFPREEIVEDETVVKRRRRGIARVRGGEEAEVPPRGAIEEHEVGETQRVLPPSVDLKAEAWPPVWSAEAVPPLSDSRGGREADAVSRHAEAEPQRISQSHADSKAEALPPHSIPAPDAEVRTQRVSQSREAAKVEAFPPEAEPRRSHSRADRKPEPEPVIVEIGRIEVVPAPPPPAPPASPAGVSPMSLDGYLTRRKERR